MKIVLILAACAALSACVFTPQMVSRYDAECGVEQRHLELKAEPYSPGQPSGCDGDSCWVVAAAYALIPAASALVSGSIVLVGNTVYWLEQRRDCLG